MKKYFVLFVMILFFFGCWVNYSHRLDYYFDPPDNLYGPMKSLLLEMGYKITIEAPHPDITLAAMGHKDPYLVGEKNLLRVTVTFKKAQIKTQVEINVSQIGAVAVSMAAIEEIDRVRDDIALKFMDKMRR